jgi:hypothetical protein
MVRSWLADEIRRLAKLARPKDGSAPLDPVMKLGGLVATHSELIATALERKGNA